MPLLFLVAGLILIVTAIRGTTSSFASRLSGDVSSAGFLKWLAAILVIGALGYAPPLKEPSRYLLALVALVILLTNGAGFISQFVQQLENPGTATPPAPAGGNPNLPAIPVQTSGGVNAQPGSGNVGGGAIPGAGAFNPGNIGSLASTFASILPNFLPL